MAATNENKKWIILFSTCSILMTASIILFIVSFFLSGLGFWIILSALLVNSLFTLGCMALVIHEILKIGMD